MLHFLRVHLGGREIQLPGAGNQLQELIEGTHALHLSHGREKVLQRELPLAQNLVLKLRLLLCVHGALGPLDQAHHVSHLQNSTRESVGIGRVDVVDSLPRADELDRLPRHAANREGGAPPGVPVHLGQHDPVDVEGLVEALRDPDRLLTRHGVRDQQHLVRTQRVADAAQLVHEGLVNL